MEFPLMYTGGLASGADRAQSVAHAAARAGLTLTDGDVRSICAACERALRESNRIELESGLPEALVEAFGNSPWLDPAVETLGALAELFYILKNETHDRISDESLLRQMRETFDGPCRGSVERLADLLGGGLYGGGE